MSQFWRITFQGGHWERVQASDAGKAFTELKRQLREDALEKAEVFRLAEELAEMPVQSIERLV